MRIGDRVLSYRAAMRPGKSISLSLFLSLLFFPRPSRVGYSLTANDSTRICNTAGRACIYSRRSSVTFDRVLTSYIRRTRFSVINVLIFRSRFVSFVQSGYYRCTIYIFRIEARLLFYLEGFVKVRLIGD